MSSTITEMKNILEGVNSRITEAEEQVSQRENRMVEKTAEEQNKEKNNFKNENCLRNLWDSIKHTNIQIIRGPRRRRERV